MPRNERPRRIGPRSGRVNHTAMLLPQTQAQLFRLYNTSNKFECPAHVNGTLAFTVSTACSRDFMLSSGETVKLGVAAAPNTEGVEAVYEIIPSAGLRSGRFKRPNSNLVIIGALGTVSAMYRVFNTRRSNPITVTINGAQKPIKVESSADFLVLKSAEVTVAPNDVGVYDFLAFDLPGAEVDGTVRSGHFKTPGTIVDLSGSAQSAVYRLINSGLRDIHYTGMPTGEPLEPDSSCDIEIAKTGTLAVTASTVGTGPIQGSYELLKVN